MINYSFIIPHKNCPDLLKRCISSIPQREDIQIIVVDDCSDSNYSTLLLDLTKNIELVKLVKSEGAGSARNAGLSIAKGKWVIFVDCDDFYVDGFISVLDKYIDSDLDVLYFNYVGIYSDSMRQYTRYNKLTNYYYKFDNSINGLNKIRYGITMPWNKMIRMEVLRRFSLDFEVLPKGNDVRFSYMVAYFSRKVAVEIKPLYYWTLQPNSVTHQHLSYSKALSVVILREKSRYFLLHMGIAQRGVYALILRYLIYNGLSDAWRIFWAYCRNKNKIMSERKSYLTYIESRIIETTIITNIKK